MPTLELSDGMKSSEILVFLLTIAIIIGGTKYAGMTAEEVNQAVNAAMAYILGRSGVKAAKVFKDPHARS